MNSIRCQIPANRFSVNKMVAASWRWVFPSSPPVSLATYGTSHRRLGPLKIYPNCTAIELCYQWRCSDDNVFHFAMMEEAFLIAFLPYGDLVIISLQQERERTKIRYTRQVI